jgi:sigma-B regulation protein RsbU (phosphoserine phosphatase)
MTPTDFFDPSPEAAPARLSLTIDVMRELSRVNDPQDMYRVYSRRMREIFPTARQISLSRRDLAPPRVRVTRFSQWTQDVNPWKDADRLPLLDRGLFSELMHTGRPRVIDELNVAADDPALPYLEGQHSLLAIPLYEAGDAVNMVVVTREEPSAFPAERVPQLMWMSNLFGRAIQTALLSQKLKNDHEQARHEMRRVARLQRSLLPTELPRVSTLDLAVYSRTTSEAGGDYYNVIPLPRGRVGLLIADVCGHGAAAAMLVAVVHSLVTTYTGPAISPGHLLAYVNDHLSRLSARSTGMFVTAVYAVYDPDRATLRWANAGHPPPRLLRGETGERQELTGERCVPLGIVAETVYAETEVALFPGDEVVLHTDGVTEAKNHDDEMFGIARLDAVMKPTKSGARALLGGVLEALETFTGGMPPLDDYTLLVMKFVQSQKKAGEISGEWRAVGQ